MFDITRFSLKGKVAIITGGGAASVRPLHSLLQKPEPRLPLPAARRRTWKRRQTKLKPSAVKLFRFRLIWEKQKKLKK